MSQSPVRYQVILKYISSLEQFIREYDDMISLATAQHQTICSQIENDHRNQMKNIETEHKKNTSVVQSNATKLIKEAETINCSVEKMDANLLQVDKYYHKFTESRTDKFRTAAIAKYGIGTSDYVATLQRMKEDYYNISRKYAEEMLPAILNGLNYLFSKARKKDYEELVMLKFGVAVYLQEVREIVPSVADETVSAILEETNKKRLDENTHYSEAIYQAKEKNSSIMGAIFETLQAELDTSFHDEIILQMFETTEEFMSELGTIQTDLDFDRLYFYFQWIRFPIRIQSPFLRKAVMDKFKPLLVNDEILFPCAVYFEEYLPIFLHDKMLGTLACQHFVYSMMYTMMSLIPVGKLEFNILDERNHGNSISPFFGTKKVLPSLFDNDLCVSHDQIAQKISKLNQYVEYTVQNTLGTHYESIFDYIRASGNDLPKFHLLICFDFPNGLDEKTLSNLNNIIVHGARCGIVTILIGDDKTDQTRHQVEYITKILEYCDQFGAGMTIASYPTMQLGMPNQAEFDAFTARYLLSFERIQNRGIAFISLVSKLLSVNEESGMNQLVQEIQTKFNFLKSIGNVPDEGIPFPDELVIGVIHYPQNVFEGTYVERMFSQAFRCTEGTLTLPFSLDLFEHGNIIIEGHEKDLSDIHAFVRNLIWCFISSMPVTKANVSIIDIKRHGSDLGSLMELIDKLPALFDNEIYTGTDQIYSKLSSINATIDERIRKKLKGIYENILQYNKATPTRSETCQLLVIYDFPSGFEIRSIKLLESILENGPRCGIYTAICYDSSIKISSYDSGTEKIEMLKSFCQVISSNAGVFSLQPFNLSIEGGKSVDTTKQEQFILNYATLAQKINSRGISIDDVLDSTLFQRDSASKIELPIGIGDGGKIVNIEMGGNGSSHHLLIGGGTGGGKSTLMHTIIMSTMLHYRPEDINLYLLDFKGGIEFKIYDTYRLPHIRLLAVDAMQEFGLSILEHIIVELNERSELCKKTIPQSNGLTSYRANKTNDMPDMPRILLIMDEFQILYNDATNRRVANRCAQLTKRIVTEGRAYGIHLIMATQSMNILRNLPIESGTIEQMRIRIGLKCGEGDASYLFSQNNAKDALKRMVGPIGTAVMNHNYTEEENIGLRVAYCSKECQVSLLEKIQDSFRNVSYDCQTFEGSAKIYLLDHLRENGLYITDEIQCTIHMGIKIEVAPPFILRIDRKSKHNLMICGANDEMTDNIVKNYLISAMLNRNSTIYCLDGEVLIGEPDADSFYKTLRNGSRRLHLAESYSDLISILLEIQEISTVRKKKRSMEPIFVLIKHMQYLELIQQMLRGESVSASEYLDNINKSDDIGFVEPDTEEIVDVESIDTDEDEDIPEALQALMGLQNTLIRHNKITVSASEQKRSQNTDVNVSRILIDLIVSGSNVGIYFVVTASDLQTLRENMRGYENTFNKFPEIIVHSMSDEDASFLISDIQVSSMPDNVAYFYDGVKNKFQFKPYVAPSVEELQQFMNGCDIS